MLCHLLTTLVPGESKAWRAFATPLEQKATDATAETDAAGAAAGAAGAAAAPAVKIDSKTDYKSLMSAEFKDYAGPDTLTARLADQLCKYIPFLPGRIML